MNDSAFPLPARALIEHQEFVRALAWSLVRDESTADDVAQETWLAYLKRPPASHSSLRGWFSTVARNHVRNAARESTRRTAREQTAARSEADDSEVELRERIALQQKVVEAVIGLKEPYKSVILLAYYEGLSANEIAQRRNVPSGTVRAQLSRALHMLRETLDREHGGERNTWSVGLLACLSGGKHAVPVTVPLLIFGAVVVVASIGARAWIASAPASTPTPLASAPVSAPASAPAAPSAAEFIREPVTNEGRISAAAPVAVASSVSVEDMKLDELLQTGQMLQRLLRERLLTPDPALLAARPDLNSVPGMTINRLWQRGALGAEQNNLVGLRGAAAFLSFATRRQDYDDEPDIALEGTFSSGFYGGSRGVVVRVGPMRLSDLGESKPYAVDFDLWNTLHEESHVGPQTLPKEFEERLLSLRVPGEPGVADHHLYLVRSVLPGEHDVLAAFEVLAHDEKSATIAWRVLHDFQIPHSSQVNDRRVALPKPTAELIALSTEELIDLHKRLVARAQHLILSVPEPIDPAYARFAAQRDGGLARIAERGVFQSILDVDGAGGYWSFTTRSNDYQKESQIGLEQGRFSTNFANYNLGLLVRLGPVALDSVTAACQFSGLDATVQKRVAFLRDLVPVPESGSSDGLEVDAKDMLRAQELGLRERVIANLGDCYLLRSVQKNKQDILVAFQIVAKDDAAFTFAWKILRQSPASR